MRKMQFTVHSETLRHIGDIPKITFADNASCFDVCVHAPLPLPQLHKSAPSAPPPVVPTSGDLASAKII